MAETRTERWTKGRLVLRALSDADAFVSARDLHALLERGEKPVGLATIYRHLHTLVASGEAEAVRTAQGELFRARPSATTPHVHLVCDTCG